MSDLHILVSLQHYLMFFLCEINNVSDVNAVQQWFPQNMLLPHSQTQKSPEQTFKSKGPTPLHTRPQHELDTDTLRNHSPREIM